MNRMETWAVYFGFFCTVIWEVSAAFWLENFWSMFTASAVRAQMKMWPSWGITCFKVAEGSSSVCWTPSEWRSVPSLVLDRVSVFMLLFFCSICHVVKSWVISWSHCFLSASSSPNRMDPMATRVSPLPTMLLSSTTDIYCTFFREWCQFCTHGGLLLPPAVRGSVTSLTQDQVPSSDRNGC